MVLDLIVKKSYDGYDASIPSVKGCESWSKTEDEVIDKCLESLRYYLNLDEKNEIKIDKARIEDETIIYKLIIKK